METHMVNYYLFIKKYLKSQFKWVSGLSVLLLVNTTLRLLSPRFLRQVIDGIVGQGKVNQIISLLIVFLIIIFMEELIKIFSAYISNKIGWSAANRLRKDLLECCIGKKDEADEFTEGEMIEIINGDVQILTNFFSLLFISIIQAVLIVSGTILAIFMENKMIGALETVFVIFVFWVFGKIHNFAVVSFKRDREHASAFYGYLGECLKAKEDLVANGAVLHIHNQLYGLLKKWFPDYKLANMKGYTSYAVYIFIVSLSYAIVFGLGAVLWLQGLVTAGTIYLLYQYNQNLIQPIESLRRQMDEMQKVSASMERIQVLLSQPVESETGEREVFDKCIQICVENVHFSYKENEKILRNVSFTLEQNKLLGLIGRTGSGKTTLVKLLTGIYYPQQGQILINGVSIEKISIKTLRENISYVTQDVQLFEASLRDNITFFDLQVKDAQIIELIQELGLKSWYDNLEQGLNTIVNVHQLSLGQAQLVALIRAFFKKSKLVILDEAHCNIDPFTAKCIQNAMDRLLLNRTGIIITHKMGTLRRLDKIILMDNGRVSEEGGYLELLGNKNSQVYQLLKKNAGEVLA